MYSNAHNWPIIQTRRGEAVTRWSTPSPHPKKTISRTPASLHQKAPHAIRHNYSPWSFRQTRFSQEISSRETVSRHCGHLPRTCASVGVTQYPGSCWCRDSRVMKYTHPLLTNTKSAETRHSPKVGWMLVHRRRRWANIEPTLGECLVSAGTSWLTCCSLSLSMADGTISWHNIGPASTSTSSYLENLPFIF